MALGVMYGENCFHFRDVQYRIEDDYSEDEDEAGLTIDIDTLKHGPWGNLREVSHTIFGNVVSPIDCLDMISQTSSGQTFLKRLVINFDFVPWLRVMDGVLVRILKRMRGLQSLELDFDCNWDDTTFVPTLPRKYERLEATARDFLLLIKEELSHIKEITIEWNEFLTNASKIETWMSHEMKKRNESWAPPLPRYKKFSRTFSPMSIMDTEIATSVVQLEARLRPKRHKGSLAHLKRKCGVF